MKGLAGLCVELGITQRQLCREFTQGFIEEIIDYLNEKNAQQR